MPDPTTTTTSSIPSDVEIHGSLTFRGDLTFDGRLEGGGITGKTLILGSRARVTGDIVADELTVDGIVTGNVTVTGKCELKGSAQVIGNITAGRLVMGDGATFIGQADINTRRAPAPAAPPTRK